MLFSKKYRFYKLIALIVFICLGILLFFVFSKSSQNKLIVPIVNNNLDITFGSDSAKVKVYMFADYNCSHCKRFLIEVFPQIQNQFINKGEVQFTLKLLTFSQSENIIAAYKVAVCLNQYGDFMPLNDLLLHETETIYSTSFKELIDEYIDRNSNFAECYLGGDAEVYLNNNIKQFIVNQFKGTPTFVIDNKVYRGYMDFAKFTTIISK
jgi:protein-disulfide isomerase